MTNLLIGREPDLHSSRMSGQHVEIHGHSGGTLGNKFHVPDGWVVLYAGLNNRIERVRTRRGFETHHALKILTNCTQFEEADMRHTQSRT